WANRRLCMTPEQYERRRARELAHYRATHPQSVPRPAKPPISKATKAAKAVKVVRPPLDLTGMQFGKLTVDSRVNPGRASWLCVCECGSHTQVRTEYLMNGTTRSCGCMRGKRVAPLVDPM